MGSVLHGQCGPLAECRCASGGSISRCPACLRSEVDVDPPYGGYEVANGFSSERLCGVISSAPVSVMYMSSSRRTPNSPVM